MIPICDTCGLDELQCKCGEPSPMTDAETRAELTDAEVSGILGRINPDLAKLFDDMTTVGTTEIALRLLAEQHKALREIIEMGCATIPLSYGGYDKEPCAICEEHIKIAKTVTKEE